MMIFITFVALLGGSKFFPTLVGIGGEQSGQLVRSFFMS